MRGRVRVLIKFFPHYIEEEMQDNGWIEAPVARQESKKEAPRSAATDAF
jgi:hypothetical protein